MKKYWPELKIVGSIYLLWRTWLFVLAVVAERLLPFKESFPYVGRLSSSGLPGWLWSWGNFDGVHYVQLAAHGYSELGLQVFFPLYPLAIKLLSFLTNNLVASGLIISNVSIFFGAWLFYRLISKEYGKQEAMWAIIFLFAFPASLFFGAMYTESLFFLLLMLSFSAKGVFAGIFGGLASGVRLVGSFLVFRSWLSLAGIVGYMSYLWINFGNPIIFLSGQSAFGNARADSLTKIVLPPQVIYRYLKIFITASVSHYDFWVAAGEFAAFLFGLGVLLYLTFRKKVPAGWLLFSWAAFLLPTLSGTFSSMPRYLVVVFPIYVFLATIKNLKVRLGILGLFILILSLFVVLFTRGYWVS